MNNHVGIGRIYVAVALLLSLMLGLASCGGRALPPAAMEILMAMQAAMPDSAQTLPEGLIYTLHPAEGEGITEEKPEYLSATLLAALYGEAARGLIPVETDKTNETEETDEQMTVPPINDVAIFLSLAPHPCEMAVFRCSDARGAATAAKLCRARADLVRRSWAGTEWADTAGRATVAVEGNYVLFVVADDPDRILRATRRALH